MASSGGFWKLVRIGVTVLVILLSVLAWIGRKSKMGTKLQITKQESVNYSGTVTEQEAQSLGRVLQETGYFSGESERDVLYNKGEDGVSVSFVLQDGKWNDAEVVAGFENFGRQIATTVGGPPFTLHLIDGKLNTKKSLTIDTAESYFKHSGQETVRYFAGVTEDDARKLGQALQTAGYFDNTSPAEVLLKVENDGYAVSFMVKDGSWDDAQIIAQYEEFGRQIAPAMGTGPLIVNMVDVSLQTRWTTSVSAGSTEPPATNNPATTAGEPQ
jgi:hypothetical protein